ncbi:peptide YY-A-like [Dendrobates tinctorius]|uniref:peptide YY-A-like n=1 Tax=Dendrobates tinctorius TaxID=92724 RepID=UPI003CC9A269
MLRYFSVVLFFLLALNYMSSAAPHEPNHPGDQASPEQLAKYYQDLYDYITFVTRPRFGKRWNDVGVEDVPSYKPWRLGTNSE